MRNFCALILLIWRIWTCNKSRSLMRVPVPRRISPGWWWIFFLSICFCDWRPVDYRVADACVDTLRVQACAEHKKGNYHCRADFQRFRFHIFVFRKISQPATQTDVRGGKFKKDLRSCVAIRPAFSSLLS